MKTLKNAGHLDGKPNKIDRIALEYLRRRFN